MALMISYHQAVRITEDKEIAQSLDLNIGQLRKWLKRAVQENRINKLSRPVRYQKAK